MQTYSIIRFPYKIDSFLNGDNPDLTEVFKPTKPKTRFSERYFLTVSIISLIICMFLFDNHKLGSIAFFLFSILNFATFIDSYKKYNKEKQFDLKRYEAQLHDFENAIKHQNEMKAIVNDINKLKKYAKGQIIKIASTATKFENVSYNFATKGNSERYFYSELKKIFGDKIIIDVTIPNQEWSFPYMPDIIFYDDNIIIDIEIDEPYSYNKLQPTHYFDTEKKRHIDTERDDFFTQNYWIVIRFTERQVYQNPSGCCKVIAEVINKICENKSYLMKLNGIKDLISENYWTQIQAKQYASENYRNTYNGTVTL